MAEKTELVNDAKAALEKIQNGELPANLPGMPDVGALRAKAMEAAQKAMDEASAKQAEAQTALEGATGEEDNEGALDMHTSTRSSCQADMHR